MFKDELLTFVEFHKGDQMDDYIDVKMELRKFDTVTCHIICLHAPLSLIKLFILSRSIRNEVFFFL